MTNAVAIPPEVALFRQQAELVRLVVGANLHGVTHAESLVRPRPEGNSLNWVLGHLLWTHNQLVTMLGQEPVVPAQAVARYARGEAPLTDPAEASDFAELLAAWERACDRIDAGLAALTTAALDAPGVATGDPDLADETFRISLGTALFHQAYHAGQTGVLRRVAGKDGAIR